MIIGVCGFIGSGKDTVADYLVNFHAFRRDSFAGSLKDAVAAVFGWDRELLEGRTKQSREWREEKDEWWSNRLGIHITPRHVLQQWGTEVCREGFHDDIWIASVENKLRSTTDDVVISDCRFPNEVKAIQAAGGKVVRVVRGENPEWFTLAHREPHMMHKTYPHVHASEYSWVNTKFDYVLDNNGSIEDLYKQIKNLV